MKKKSFWLEEKQVKLVEKVARKARVTESEIARRALSAYLEGK